MHFNPIHSRWLSLSILDKVLKEIVIENVRDAFQQFGVDGGVGIHLIQMVGGARYLACKPYRGSALLLQHGFDSAPYVYVVDAGHKKSVELNSCLNVRVTTPSTI